MCEGGGYFERGGPCLKGFPELKRPEKAPYSTTKISAFDSQNEINKLLELYGITDTAWVRSGDQYTLAFSTMIEIRGEVRKLGFKFNPPLFTTKRKTWNKELGKYEFLDLPNLAQSMRLLYDYLRMKLAAVSWGLRPFEEEFLAEVVVQTPQGSQRFADLVKHRGLLALPDTTQNRVIEAEATETDGGDTT